MRTPPPRRGPDEVRSLAGALNAMLARLEGSTAALQRALEATRRFAADVGTRAAHAAHQPARHPRCARAQGGLAGGPACPRCCGERPPSRTDRAPLDGFQALARGEAADALPREDVELADLVDAAVLMGPGAGIRASRLSSPTASCDCDKCTDRANACAGGSTPARQRRAARARRRARARRPRASTTGRLPAAGRRRPSPASPPGERARLLEPFTRGQRRRRRPAPDSGWPSWPSR